MLDRGTVRIAGYRRPMLDAFSTRRRELLDCMHDRG